MLRHEPEPFTPMAMQLDRGMALLRRLFVGRTDTYAEQQPDGRYLRRPGPLTEEILRAHVRGERTVGAYQLDPEAKVRYLAFDLDAADGRRWSGTSRRYTSRCGGLPPSPGPRACCRLPSSAAGGASTS